MNSLAIRNTALLIIFCLLWVVLHGIYENHNRYIKAQEAQVYREQRTERYQGIKHSSQSPELSPTVNRNGNNNERSLTSDEIQQIAMTGRLPKWVKNADDKRLSLEEVEEIVTTGKLPSSRR